MAANITDDIAPYDLSKFTTSLTKNILSKWNVAERIKAADHRIFFQHPSGVPCGELKWDVLVLRLSKKEGAHVNAIPRMFNKSLKLQDITIEKLDTYHNGETIQAVAFIDTGSHPSRPDGLTGHLFPISSACLLLLVGHGIGRLRPPRLGHAQLLAVGHPSFLLHEALRRVAVPRRTVGVHLTFDAVSKIAADSANFLLLFADAFHHTHQHATRIFSFRK